MELSTLRCKVLSSAQNCTNLKQGLESLNELPEGQFDSSGAGW